MGLKTAEGEIGTVFAGHSVSISAEVLVNNNESTTHFMLYFLSVDQPVCAVVILIRCRQGSSLLL